jgi:hypothetical protein
MTNAAVIPTEDEYMEIPKFCIVEKRSPSTVHSQIRKGRIALHQFMGDPRPKINVVEARQVLSTVKRKYSFPTLRIVRHDDAPQKTELPKVDLFT